MPIPAAIIGTGVSIGAGMIKSRLAGSVCSGPYNYDAASGLCIPKPDCRTRAPSDPCVPHQAGGGAASGPGITIPGYGGSSFAPGGPCQPGYEWRNGRCEKTGIIGGIQRAVPGGETGVQETYTYSGEGWSVTDTLWGPGYVPMAVDRPTLTCPPGFVLCGNRGGKNPGMEVCLPKSKARGCRKWPRGPRPLLTGGEMKTLRRAKSLERKVRKAWRAAGSPGKPKPCPKGRKR